MFFFTLYYIYIKLRVSYFLIFLSYTYIRYNYTRLTYICIFRRLVNEYTRTV